MQKHITIFLSVILAIMILLIPSNKVKAENTLINLNDIYDNLNLTIGQSNLLDLIEYLQDYTDDYYILLVKSYSDNSYNLSVVEKSTSSLVKRINYCDSYYTYYHRGSNNAINFMLNYGNYLSVSFDSNDYDSSIASFKNNLENHNLTHLSSKSYVGMFEDIRGNQRVLLYSNVDWYLCNINGYNQSSNDNYIYNNSIIYNNDIFPSYYYHFMSSIDISSNSACDSNEKDMELVTIDFSNFDDPNYTYQYGLRLSGGNTSNGTTIWLDQDTIIWHDIDDLTSIGTYNLNVYYDKAVVYARVLQNGQEKAKAAYVVNNDLLPRFLIFSTATIAQINEYDNNYYTELVTFNIDNVYNPNYLYEYSWDGRTWHSLPFAEGETRCSISNYLQLLMYIRIVDENGNELYIGYADRTQDDIRNYDSNRFSVKYNEGIACDSNRNNIINVRINLTNITTFTHQYGFRVIINGDTYYNLPLYETILNNDNLITSYNVKIYIDTFKIFEETYNVGNLPSYENITFDNLYNKIQQDVIDDFNGNNTSNISGATDLVMRFLNTISEFVAGFFDLMLYFYNRLNSWLRAYILAIFNIFIICKVIKVARKK